MKLRKINDNCVEITGGSYSLLFSYATLVGVHKDGQGYYVSDVRYSSTTSKHINGWLGGAKKNLVAQDVLESFVFCLPMEYETRFGD